MIPNNIIQIFLISLIVIDLFEVLVKSLTWWQFFVRLGGGAVLTWCAMMALEYYEVAGY